ncbi:unnamed protein product [Pleuronectes platessa]|uniref:B30.2/SPRY domain-containing protein n=1 Tax=Pleuronectes platessa TaxID=8262 RepID=A0A9N7UBF8_PLEPL|nr:unnamed protein product [Pleuronectes platessa]
MSREHKVHECGPLEEAAKEKKTEISTMLESVRKKLKTLNKTEEQWRETKSYIQTQALQNEKEEEVRTQVMWEKLENIRDQIRGVASIISDIEGALRGEDLKFLKDYKKTKKRVQCNIREPECIRDILINSAKHLGSLKFAVYKSMAELVEYVPITLDPNTAHSNLELSEELTCVQYSRRQLLPDNPERCTSRLCVLGAAGLASGKHSWTVQVGQSKEWYIGVVRESVQRKSTIFLNPAEGFWTSPPTKLVLKQRPERITVVLDCDKGKVVFINAADLTTIHTFKDRFTEKIFPYVSTGLYDEGKICSRLTICPLTITLNVE